MIRKYWLRFALAFLLGFAPVILFAKTFGTITSTEDAVVTTDVAIVTNAMLAGSISSFKLIGTDIQTLGTITTGTWRADKIGLAYGGTNANLYATGGTSQVLQQTSAGAAITVGQLAHSGLSGLTSGDDHTQYLLRSLLTTLGDTPYGGAAGAWTRLPGNITTTRNFLRQTGTGAVSDNPAWDTVTKTDVGLSAVLNVEQEPALGNPSVTGYVLSSTDAGVRSWVAQPTLSSLGGINAAQAFARAMMGM
ncbi:MAG: hypothetical protein UY28_C0004G0032 [Candidatus Amesbacteria bacterium GW2011_GWB1_48_13]|uniref:Uncharacterized protein n=1 Tax=Candidatus Amesbacteria bacterium GW2011_GWB1_48_13 TaxID=1618362 RepID=A0A0G1UVK7_9BACT|nr:MAG: hypothetical protein UY28_C0004G0032 [Candidatus Amesbacteria bacterium GW2011_GWB1_48_13]